MPDDEGNPTTNTPSETKLCYIAKRPDFDGYGFNLHSEKIKPGQFIGKVDANSPALLAGLKEGDQIVEVNGVPIGNETHKQVVQRIKAISNEVHLLLIDVDGAPQKSTRTKIEGTGDVTTASTTTATTRNVDDITTALTRTSTTKNDSENHNNNANEYNGNVQEILGTSANISTISMISTKRMSNTTSNGSQTSAATDVPGVPAVISIAEDVTDHTHEINSKGTNVDVTTSSADTETKMHEGTNTESANNNIKSKIITPPPPSATSAVAPQIIAATTTTMSGNGNKAGNLQLPLTAAEMRAKLMSKKKYDPKNESVDLKKKFEIIQKL